MADDKKTDLKKVTPNSVPPKEGESVLVDRSAPADNNVAEIKSGNRKGNGDLATTQPGDPKVRTNEGGVITERDATDEEVKSVDARTAPVQLTEAQERDEANDFGGENGQRERDEDGNEVASEEKTVELENPSGKVVEMPISMVGKHQLFAAGFKTVKGKSYPSEITDLEKAYKGSVHARNIYTDVDNGDNGQSMSQNDVLGRKGTSEVGDVDGEPQPNVEVPNTKVMGKTFDAVDQRENGQIVDPKTNKPLKNTRLSAALQNQK